MKKILILFVSAGLLVACNNDKNGKETDKNKGTVTTREKDDYRSNDSKNTGTADEDEPKQPATDEIKTVTTSGKEDWGNTKNTGGWSASDAKRFMNDCERTARKNVTAERANQYCDCMLQKLVAMFPTYTDADRELAGNAKDKLAGMVDECNNQ